MRKPLLLGAAVLITVTALYLARAAAPFGIPARGAGSSPGAGGAASSASNPCRACCTLPASRTALLTRPQP